MVADAVALFVTKLSAYPRKINGSTISSISAISVSVNDIRCKYLYVFTKASLYVTDWIIFPNVQSGLAFMTNINQISLGQYSVYGGSLVKEIGVLWDFSLFLYDSYHAKSYQRVVMRFSWQLRNDTRNNWLDMVWIFRATIMIQPALARHFTLG